MKHFAKICVALVLIVSAFTVCYAATFRVWGDEARHEPTVVNDTNPELIVWDETDAKTFPTLPDISPKKVDAQQINFQGDFLQKFNGGYLFEYSKQYPVESYLAFLDAGYNLVWEHEINPTIGSLHPFEDEGIFVHTYGGYSYLNKNGSVAWKIEKLDDFFEVALSDHEGGVYLFGRKMVYHINHQGQIKSQEQFKGIENLSALNGWSGVDGGYWLLGEKADIGINKRFLSYLDADLNVKNTVELLEGQYPTVAFYPENNKILLYGQAYKNDKEYGFVYEVDYNLKQKKYFEFDDCVPHNIVKLKDGRWLVSSYTRENVAVDVIKLFNEDWKDVSTVHIEYAFTSLYALDDGGFAIAGGRLSPGQPYVSLFVSSRPPKIDLIYERYDEKYNLKCRKTFSSQNSSSGYGYSSYVDTSGKIYLF